MTVSFGTTYPVPNAQINFTPTTSCASITFNSSLNGGTWVSTIPTSGNVDNIFFDGLALPVPNTLVNVQSCCLERYVLHVYAGCKRPMGMGGCGLYAVYYRL